MNPLPLRAFVMYAHEDKPVRDKLLQHLRPLEKSGALRLWSDHEIKPGELWDQEIRRRLGESDLIVMLVSDDFFNSDYIHDVEMTEALDRHNRGAARLLPVIARHCLWQDVPEIARLQVLPPEGRPVVSSKWDSPDEPYLAVVKGVKEAIAALRKDREKPAPPPAPAPRPAPVPPPATDPRRWLLPGAGVLLAMLMIWGVWKITKVPGKQPEAATAAARDTSSGITSGKTTTRPPATKQEPKPQPVDTPGKKPEGIIKIDRPSVPGKSETNPGGAQTKPGGATTPPAGKKETVQPAFDKEYPAVEGMARVKKGNEWGFMNKYTGKIIGWFSDAENFDGGKAFVTKNGRSYYINKSGACVEGCAAAN